MIDHFSISVNDYTKSLRFYDKTLAIIGYSRIATVELPDIKTAGYGKEGKPSFWISPMGNPTEEIGKARGVHVAFLAPSTESIQTWHKACLELGGKNNGAPGARPHYHAGYFGAFIIDPDGWRIEACLHHYSSI